MQRISKTLENNTIHCLLSMKKSNKQKSEKKMQFKVEHLQYTKSRKGSTEKMAVPTDSIAIAVQGVLK